MLLVLLLKLHGQKSAINEAILFNSEVTYYSTTISGSTGFLIWKNVTFYDVICLQPKLITIKVTKKQKKRMLTFFKKIFLDAGIQDVSTSISIEGRKMMKSKKIENKV